jgi:hypothetical protein
VRHACGGGQACVICYGAHGSGKEEAMCATPEASADELTGRLSSLSLSDELGIAARALQEMAAHAREHGLKLSLSAVQVRVRVRVRVGWGLRLARVRVRPCRSVASARRSCLTLTPTLSPTPTPPSSRADLFRARHGPARPGRCRRIAAWRGRTRRLIALRRVTAPGGRALALALARVLALLVAPSLAA